MVTERQEVSYFRPDLSEGNKNFQHYCTANDLCTSSPSGSYPACIARDGPKSRIVPNLHCENWPEARLSVEWEVGQPLKRMFDNTVITTSIRL